MHNLMFSFPVLNNCHCLQSDDKSITKTHTNLFVFRFKKVKSITFPPQPVRHPQALHQSPSETAWLGTP